MLESRTRRPVGSVAPTRSRGGLALLGLTLMASAGCGYSLGYRAPPSVTSIAVPIFHNATFPLRRELEFALTSATRKQIQTRTSLVLVDSDEADMVVKGTISDFRERVVAEGRNDEKLESRVLITVSLLVEDYQNKKRWEERIRVDEPVSFDAGETIETGRQRAIEDLAEKIVNTLDSW